MRSRRSLRYLVLSLVTAVFAMTSLDVPAQAASYVPLNGSGSSWAEPAIDQWSKDVASQHIVINFNGDGSAAGRQAFIVNQADFAASDIAFLTKPDPFGGGIENPAYAYSYIPIVAGGTSFLYNLVVGGKKVTNLRLSGQTVADIFTGRITNWDDKRITHDYGAQLPNQPITVVSRSDGSGASYQFSQWLAKDYPADWNAYCTANGGPSPCGPTEFFPAGHSTQRNGSDQAADFIGSSTGEGSIGYDEYAYALNDDIPVVKLLNAAGYYTLPSPSNVAIALQKAQINENPSSPDFLMQDLDSVYGYTDPRTYPLSSYSYLIVPRDKLSGKQGPPPSFTTGKGTTLSTWMNYVLCGAQQKAGNLGYSPLPKNLVVGGFQQVDHIPGHIATPDLTQLNNCDNPTYHNGVNYLIKDAAMPSPCDYKTAPLACKVVDGKAAAAGGAGSGSGGRSGTSAAGSGSNAAGGGTGAAGTANAGGGGSGADRVDQAAPPSIP